MSSSLCFSKSSSRKPAWRNRQDTALKHLIYISDCKKYVNFLYLIFIFIFFFCSQTSWSWESPSFSSKFSLPDSQQRLGQPEIQTREALLPYPVPHPIHHHAVPDPHRDGHDPLLLSQPTPIACREQRKGRLASRSAISQTRDGFKYEPQPRW